MHQGLMMDAAKDLYNVGKRLHGVTTRKTAILEGDG
jgi:hypothetical protein